VTASRAFLLSLKERWLNDQWSSLANGKVKQWVSGLEVKSRCRFFKSPCEIQFPICLNIRCLGEAKKGQRKPMRHTHPYTRKFHIFSQDLSSSSFRASTAFLIPPSMHPAGVMRKRSFSRACQIVSSITSAASFSPR